MKPKILLMILLINITNKSFAEEFINKNINIIKNHINDKYYEIKINDFNDIKEFEINKNLNFISEADFLLESKKDISFYLKNIKNNPKNNIGIVFNYRNNKEKINIIQIPQKHLKTTVDCSLYLMLNELYYCNELEEETELKIKQIFQSIYSIKIEKNILHNFYILHEYSHLLKENNYSNPLYNEIHADLTSHYFFNDDDKSSINIIFKRKFEEAINFEKEHNSYKILENFKNKETFNEQQKEIKNIILKIKNKNIEYNSLSKSELESFYKKNIDFIKKLKELSNNKNIKRKDRYIIQKIYLSLNLKNISIKRKIKKLS